MILDLNNVKRDGFVQFQGDVIGKDTLTIANELGTIAHMPGVQVVQSLVPLESIMKKASSYSGNFGMSEFPFHTDLAHWYQPPRYLLLKCVIPTIAVSTNIVLSAPLFLQENKNDLRRALFRPRRRLDGRLSLLRLFENDFYRWDPLFLRPLSNTAKLLQRRIEQKILESTPNKVVLASTKDCVLIDNWNTFHARSSVPLEAITRKVERVYLSSLKG